MEEKTEVNVTGEEAAGEEVVVETMASGEADQPPKNKKKKILLIIGVIVLVLLVIYLAGGLYLKNRFLPGTVVNGLNVGMKTAEQADEALAGEVGKYTLTITDRDGNSETIDAATVNLATDFGTGLVDAIASQNSFLWPVAIFQPETYTLEQGLQFDETALNQAVSALNCMDSSKMKKAESAHLSEYKEGTGYELVASVPGTEISKSVMLEKVKDAIINLQPELDLAADGCYTEPEFKEGTEEADALLAKANQMVQTAVTFTFGSKSETVDENELKDWITIDGTELTLDEDSINEYVANLASTYDTKGQSKQLASSYGVTVTVPGGNYGWEMDTEATAQKIKDCVENGEDYTGEAEYIQTAASHDGNDYGNSYVEVNIAAQEVYLYIDGELVLSDDVTTGKPSVGDSTPCGAYHINYKQAPAVLRGEDYESPVNFWMPFYGGYGLHDAPWKKVYGGKYYLTIGSHGCVNLKYNTAKKIYNSVEAGFPVLVYYLNGTERYDTMRNLDKSIAALGDITLDKAATIAKLEATYQALTDQEKGSVENYAVLQDAEAKIAALQAQATAAQAAAAQAATADANAAAAQ